MAAPPPKPLTARQKRFCEEYAAPAGTAVRAYFAAFGRTNKYGQKRSYAGAAQCAKRLLAQERVQAELQALRGHARRHARLTLEALIRLQIDSATVDQGDFFEEVNGEPVPIPPSRLPIHARRCVKAFEVERRLIKSPKGDTVLHQTERIKYVLHDAQKARDSLAKMLGYDAPQTPLESLLAALSPATRAAVAAELAPLALGR